MKVGMNIKHIIIDANILIKKYNFDSAELIKLVKLKDYFDLNLHLPKVVYDECIGNYKEDADECYVSLSKSLRKFQTILVNIEKTKFDSDGLLKSLQSLSIYYQPKLDSFLSKNNINILPYPNVKHEEVVKKIYDKTLPFGHSKCSEKGYKDYLIVKTIEEFNSYSDDVEGAVVVYTNNISDFVKGNSKDLKNRLLPVDNEINLPGVYVTSSLDSIIDKLMEDFSTTILSVKDNYESMSDEIGNAIVGNILLSEELYGSALFEPDEIKNKLFSLSNIVVEKSDDGTFLEMRGKIKVQFDCNFTVSSFGDEYENECFIFYEKIKAVIKSKGYEGEEFWEIKFSDFQYCRVFNFSYTDFEFNDSEKLIIKEPEFSISLH
jgi:hypothetical protein